MKAGGIECLPKCGTRNARSFRCRIGKRHIKFIRNYCCFGNHDFHTGAVPRLRRYRLFPRNSKKPRSLRTCSCCRIFGRIFRLPGCNENSSCSDAYTSANANSVDPIRSTILSTSTNHPRVRGATLWRPETATNLERTADSGTGSPFATSDIFPSAGTSCRSMLQPTQPARRALAASGFRRSIVLSTKKNAGTNTAFWIVHALV